MKNLKKISRDQLKQVNGGVGACSPGYVFRCPSIDICDPEHGFDNCPCGCYPK